MYKYAQSTYSRKNKSYYKKPFRKTKGFYILLALIILIFIFIFWSIKNTENETSSQPKYSDQTGLPSMSGKLSFINGEVEIKKTEQEWQKVSENFQVETGDRLKTGQDSRAIIELPDQSIIRVKENSELEFNELGMADIIIEQKSGTCFHRVNNQSTAIYRVKNGETELTALGTGFNVFTSSKLTYLTVTEGRVKTKIYNGDSIANMRTVESGTRAELNPGLSVEKSIQTKSVKSDELLQDEWYSWNLEKDQNKNYFSGIFEKALKLIITEPEKTEIDTEKEKITISGSTDPLAEIFMAGQELENNNGVFNTDYLLGTGENEITITVKKGQNQNKKTLTVNCTKKEQKIKLSGETLDNNQVKLSWEANQLNDFVEFKVLKGTKENPTYPEAPYHSLDSDLNGDQWGNLENKDYYFRICALSENNTCVAYSNNFLASFSNDPIDGKITLNASLDNDQVSLKWSLSSGLDDSNGLKTLISQISNPTYPQSTYHSLDSGERQDDWTNLDPGTYYFRVCLIKNNECQIYSNEQTVTLEEQKEQPKITLSVNSHNGNVTLLWSASDLPPGDGYKILKSNNPGVSCSASENKIIDSHTQYAYTWQNLSIGQTYYFKICQNQSGQCSTCSQEIPVAVK